MDFYPKRPERCTLGTHLIDILRIKSQTETMRLGKKIIFQGAHKNDFDLCSNP